MSNYEKVKVWRKDNADKVAAQARRYRARHPEQVKAVKDAYRERSREHRLPHEAEMARRKRAANPELQHARYQRWRAKRESERETEAGRPRPELCEICGECNIRIVFDHCHLSGRFRGWICDRCNRVLGLVKDSPEVLNLLARYLTSGTTQGSQAKQSTE